MCLPIIMLVNTPPFYFDHMISHSGGELQHPGYFLSYGGRRDKWVRCTYTSMKSAVILKLNKVLSTESNIYTIPDMFFNWSFRF